jgi:hypothetical protein
MRQSDQGQPLQGGVVENLVILDQATVTMVGIFAEADVRDYAEVVDFILYGRYRSLNDAIHLVSTTSPGILGAGNSKEHDSWNTQIRDSLRLVDDLVDGETAHSGHRNDRLANSTALNDKQGEQEIVS